MGRINVVIVTRDIHCFGSKLGFDGCPESGPVQAGITVEDVPLHHPGIDLGDMISDYPTWRTSVG